MLTTALGVDRLCEKPYAVAYFFLRSGACYFKSDRVKQAPFALVWLRSLHFLTWKRYPSISGTCIVLDVVTIRTLRRIIGEMNGGNCYIERRPCETAPFLLGLMKMAIRHINAYPSLVKRRLKPVSKSLDIKLPTLDTFSCYFTPGL